MDWELAARVHRIKVVAARRASRESFATLCLKSSNRCCLHRVSVEQSAHMLKYTAQHSGYMHGCIHGCRLTRLGMCQADLCMLWKGFGCASQRVRRHIHALLLSAASAGLQRSADVYATERKASRWTCPSTRKGMTSTGSSSVARLSLDVSNVEKALAMVTAIDAVEMDGRTDSA